MTDHFETGCELVDMTSISRPDPSWRFVDAAGHVHQWCTATGEIATTYDPTMQYTVPSLKIVEDGTEIDPDDGYEYALGHLACAICDEPIMPGYTADATKQYAPGLRWFKINGVLVSPEEFARRLAERN